MKKIFVIMAVAAGVMVMAGSCDKKENNELVEAIAGNYEIGFTAKIEPVEAPATQEETTRAGTGTLVITEAGANIIKFQLKDLKSEETVFGNIEVPVMILSGNTSKVEIVAFEGDIRFGNADVAGATINGSITPAKTATEKAKVDFNIKFNTKIDGVDTSHEFTVSDKASQ